MVQKIRILTIGKIKEKWLEEALDEYRRRIRSTHQIEFVLAKDSDQLASLAEKETHKVCLDEQGKLMTSLQFSEFLKNQLVLGGSRLTLIIGGAEGLPPDLKSSNTLISLSPLTFTHQIVRLLLLEQIYRAVELEKGSPYHKEYKSLD